MDHDHFVGEVQNRARLASRGEAEAAIRGTLETLADRLEPHLAEHVASQLPSEIGGWMMATAGFERLSFDEFVDRLVMRSGMERPDAVFHARVVLEVLEEATTGVVNKVMDSLPAEFQRLFAGSEGEMPDRGRAGVKKRKAA